MKKESNDKHLTNAKSGSDSKISLEGYPHPSSEDIYKRNQKVESTDGTSRDSREGGKINKTYDANGVEANNEKGFEDDVSGGDLDIPGSELDNEQEDIGSEDEENNYYSIGGDRHDDLEEDNRE